jgi:hypothetical protein
MAATAVDAVSTEPVASTLPATESQPLLEMAPWRDGVMQPSSSESDTLEAVSLEAPLASDTAAPVPVWTQAARSEDEEPTREFHRDSITAPPPSVDAVPQSEWTGTRYFPGTDQYNTLEPHRQAEAASYQKLVATFLRTEFDSTKRRVARRLDAARRAEDALSRDLAHTALERLGEEGQLAAFEAILQDGPSVSL